MKKYVRRLLQPLIFLLVFFTGVHADWVTDSVATGANPYAVAVNPITNKTYVANNAGGTVTIINNVTDSTTTITVGSSPVALGINPVTNKIYVANSGSNSVSVIDGTTNATTSINVGTSPGAIGINTVKNLIVVANSGSSTLSIINGASNAVSTVAVGTNPCAIAIDPARNRTYIANKGSNTISVLDSTNTVSRTIAVGSSPCAVAVNVSTDTIYVANQASGTVTLIDGINYSTQTISVGSYPSAIAVNPVTNAVYVANYLGNTVTAFKAAGMGIATISTGTSPNSLAINVRTNKIYVTNAGSNSISVINGDSNTVTNISTGVSPHAVAINPITSKIYVANLGSNSVSVIDGVSFTGSLIMGGGNTSFTKVAINPFNNKIYFPEQNNGALIIWNGNTQTLVSKYISAKLYSVAINYVTNKIYVLDNQSSQITVLNGYNDSITARISVGVNPMDIAVNTNTNMIYVANMGSSTVTAINGVTNTTTTIPCGNYPRALAINLMSNKVYAAGSSAGAIIVINGFTNLFEKSIIVGDGGGINDIAVNPRTNTIYGINSSTSKVFAVNGTTNAITQIGVGSTPIKILVNAATNTIYTLSNALYYATNSISIINGATNGVNNVALGSVPNDIVINPILNMAYVSCSDSLLIIDPLKLRTKSLKIANGLQALCVNPVTSLIYIMSGYYLNVIQPYTFTNTKVSISLDTIGKSIVTTSKPSLNGMAINSTQSSPVGVIEKIMRGNGFITKSWSGGTITGNAGTNAVSWNWGSDSLMPGLNYLSCAAFESNTGTTNNCGIGTPFTGNMSVYPILYMLGQGTAVPAAPILYSPANGATAQSLSPILNWSSDTNISTYYHVQVSTTSSFATTIVNDSTLVSTSKSVVSLQNGITYYWRVNASNVIGTGQWSSVWNFTTGTSAPFAPTLITPLNAAVTVPINPRLIWNMVSGAISYTIQVAFDSTFTLLTLNDSTLTTTVKSVPSLPMYTKCFWRVKAKSTTGISPWSPVWSFTTGSQTPIIHGICKAKTLVYSCIKQGNSINYSLPQESRVSLCYYDMQGRLSANIINKVVSAGEYSLPVDHSFPTRGAYVQVFKAGSFVKQECVTFIR